MAREGIESGRTVVVQGDRIVAIGQSRPPDGAGLFARIDRLGQVLVTVAVWLVLLAVVPLWLKRFRFGPLEWLWRTATYGHIEPIGRNAKSPVPVT